MSDLKPFEHGQEGTHYSCDEQLKDLGGKAMCCGCTGHKCNPNPTEKRDSVIQKKKIMLHKTKEHATDVIPNPIVESWREEFDNKFVNHGEFVYNKGGYPATCGELKQFISSQIQQAKEDGFKQGFESLRKDIREENHAHCCYKKDLKNIIQQAEEKLVEKFREVIGEDEVKKVVPPNKDDSYDSLNAQFKVMKYNQEQLPIRNQLREEQKAKMDEFLTKLEEEKDL